MSILWSALGLVSMIFARGRYCYAGRTTRYRLCHVEFIRMQHRRRSLLSTMPCLNWGCFYAPPGSPIFTQRASLGMCCDFALHTVLPSGVRVQGPMTSGNLCQIMWTAEWRRPRCTSEGIRCNWRVADYCVIDGLTGVASS